jgi:hypothetical protein
MVVEEGGVSACSRPVLPVQSAFWSWPDLGVELGKVILSVVVVAQSEGHGTVHGRRYLSTTR